MIAQCYLQQEADQSNHSYFDDRCLVVDYKGVRHRFLLKNGVSMVVEHKKYILPIVLGGILAPFCLLMIWNNLYSPWPLLIGLLASLAGLYFGWEGTWMLTIYQQNTPLSLPIAKNGDHLTQYIAFFHEYQKGNKHKMIYHIATKQAWEDQLHHQSYIDPSLAKEGFIHASDANQLHGTLNRFFIGASDLVILQIDALLLNSPLKYEQATDGQGIFPHIFGPINKTSVVKTLHLAKAEDFSLELI